MTWECVSLFPAMYMKQGTQSEHRLALGGRQAVYITCGKVVLLYRIELFSFKARWAALYLIVVDCVLEQKKKKWKKIFFFLKIAI